MIDNTSGNDDGYGDFTDQCATFEAGETFSIELHPGTIATPPEAVFWTIFVDFNGDGDYDESGEYAAYGSGVSTMTGMLTVPEDIVSVRTTMRIVMSQNDYQTDPCEPYEVGETEDYCLILNGRQPIGSLITNLSFEDGELATRSSKEDAVKLETMKTMDYGVRVYPNPVSEVMTVEINDLDNVVRVGLYSANGQLVQSYRPSQLMKENRIQVSEMESGFYLLKSMYKDGHTETAKVIIQK